jgi:transposase
MNSLKYIGIDVHQSSISVAVLDAGGKMVTEATVKTEAAAILDFFRGLRGNLQVTFEEGTYAEWLYDLLAPQVAKIVVCDPRQNPQRKTGNKSDKIDAQKLAGWLRLGILKPVYHGNPHLRTLRELARSYLCLVRDATRVMNRLKALYRGRGIRCGGKRVYAVRSRGLWLQQLREPGVRCRAELLYQQLDTLLALRKEVRRALLAESQKHAVEKLLRSIPYLGPVRVALLIALMQTAHRFRSKRQLWAYAGLALVTRSSADYRVVEGQLERSRKGVFIVGLNTNHNHDLKEIFKGAATSATVRPGPLQEFYASKLAQGMKPELARLTLARKIAAITLTLWKKGDRFDAAQLKLQAA